MNIGASRSIMHNPLTNKTAHSRHRSRVRYATPPPPPPEQAF